MIDNRNHQFATAGRRGRVGEGLCTSANEAAAIAWTAGAHRAATGAFVGDVSLFGDPAGMASGCIPHRTRINIIDGCLRRSFHWARDEEIEGYVVLSAHSAYLTQRACARPINPAIAWAKHVVGALSLASLIFHLRPTLSVRGVYTAMERLRTRISEVEAWAYVGKSELKIMEDMRLARWPWRDHPMLADGRWNYDLLQSPIYYSPHTGSLIAMDTQDFCQDSSILLSPMTTTDSARRLLKIESFESGAAFRLVNGSSASEYSTYAAFFDACCAFDVLLSLDAVRDETIVMEVDRGIGSPKFFLLLQLDVSGRGFHVGGIHDVSPLISPVASFRPGGS